ncbi:MAG: phage major capsid protein [Phycisphaerales bacterium]
MASNLKRLQDRAAAIAARMNELAAVAERSEDQTSELRRLSDEADSVKTDLEFEGRLAAKEAELRAVVEKAAPAPAPAVAEEPKKVEIRAVNPHYSSLKAFNDGPDAVESAYRCGRWIRGVVFKNADDLRWCRDHGVEARALNEGSNAAGGALVPEEFAARVIRMVETYGTFPPAAENVNMNRDTMVIPKRVSGTTAYFIGEGASVTESEPTYTNVNLVAKKLAVACRMSTEVVEDAVVSLADACATEFATSLAYTVDTCGWIGDGTSTYGGMRGLAVKIAEAGYTASVHTAAGGNTGFETLDIEDFLGVMGKLPIYARQGAAWHLSPAGYAASIARLKYAAGGNTAENIGAGVVDTFLGYPVRIVHVLNSTLGADASKIKVLFGNVAMSSLYGRRRDFSVRLFDQVYATTDQVLLQGTMRFDINHHTLGSTTETGPVVALKTAAS